MANEPSKTPTPQPQAIPLAKIHDLPGAAISKQPDCQRQFEIVRKRRRNFVVFRRGGNKTMGFLAQIGYLQFAVSDA